MGISLEHAILLTKEAKHKPLPEMVYLIGRQTVYLSEAGLKDMLHGEGFSPKSQGIEIDSHTGGAGLSNQSYVTDATLFRMLGARQIRSIDISPYEGADIILDLNRPIPDEYEGIADFIFGGSVCDNVFNPAMYLRNISRMLKPGGRYLSQEMASNEYHPYVVLPPAWHFDYFVINEFADIQVLVFDICKAWNVYGLDVDSDYRLIPNYTAPRDHTLGVFIIAEKSATSTWDRSPTQDQYRSSQEWADYRKSLSRIRKTSRPFPTFRMPSTEKDLESLPPQWLPHHRYLGRLEQARLSPQQENLKRRMNDLVATWKATPDLRVALWGAGQFTADLMESTDLKEVDLACLVDANPTLQGQTRWGFSILSPAELGSQKVEVVLVSSSKYQDDILRQLTPLASLHGFQVITLC